MTSTPGTFVWYELATPDGPAAQAFYRRVVGWEAKDAGTPGHGYTLLCAGSREVGGIFALEGTACADAKPGWMGYIAVPDVDAYVAKVKAAGGSVTHESADIPGVGRFAGVADPYDAVFMLFQDAGGQAPEPAPPGTPGHVGWHELHAGDGAGAFAFYSRLFGWTRAEAMDMGPQGVYQMFAAGGPAMGGMMTKAPQTPTPFWLFYFNVEAIDPAIKRAEAGGGKLVMGPMEVPGGSWIAHCLDPQGVIFALVAPAR